MVAKSLTQDYPMDSMQVGKAVFVKESYTTLGIEPRTYSNPGRSGNHLVYSWVKKIYFIVSQSSNSSQVSSQRKFLYDHHLNNTG